MEPDVKLIMQQVSRYLRSHPDACDTSEGIARWWIDGDSLPLAMVEAALRWMTSCGVVEAQVAADGRVRFRRAGQCDLDARLDAMAVDPLALLRLPTHSERPLRRRRVH